MGLGGDGDFEHAPLHVLVHAGEENFTVGLFLLGGLFEGGEAPLLSISSYRSGGIEEF